MNAELPSLYTLLLMLLVLLGAPPLLAVVSLARLTPLTSRTGMSISVADAVVISVTGIVGVRITADTGTGSMSSPPPTVELSLC